MESIKLIISFLVFFMMSCFSVKKSAEPKYADEVHNFITQDTLSFFNPSEVFRKDIEDVLNEKDIEVDKAYCFILDSNFYPYIDSIQFSKGVLKINYTIKAEDSSGYSAIISFNNKYEMISYVKEKRYSLLGEKLYFMDFWLNDSLRINQTIYRQSYQTTNDYPYSMEDSIINEFSLDKNLNFIKN